MSKNVIPAKAACLPVGRESITLIKSICLDCPVKPGNDKNGVLQQPEGGII
ncbi:MAG: hypothetical protein Q7J72_02185 [Candidatus Omnitrophota bacterium]|nr:hypothetical protein [Candidatus Omnitrophota bacterium]